MTICWLRHGETALNATRVMQLADTPLSARGLLQATLAAQRIAGLAPAAILSSDLPRARQTAEAAAAATGLPIVTEPLLRERNFGDWRGRPLTSFDFDPVAAPQAPPGGESMAEFMARLARAWLHVAALRAELAGPLLVVSHGLLIRAALQAHALRDASGEVAASMTPLNVPPLANASLSIVDAGAPHRLRLVNCTAHLTGAADDDGQSLSGG